MNRLNIVLIKLNIIVWGIVILMSLKGCTTIADKATPREFECNAICEGCEKCEVECSALGQGTDSKQIEVRR